MKRKCFFCQYHTLNRYGFCADCVAWSRYASSVNFDGSTNPEHIVYTEILVLIKNVQFAIIYHTGSDMTVVHKNNKEVLSLPGCPLKPNNYKKKLPLYFTFS